MSSSSLSWWNKPCVVFIITTHGPQWTSDLLLCLCPVTTRIGSSQTPFKECKQALISKRWNWAVGFLIEDMCGGYRGTQHICWKIQQGHKSCCQKVSLHYCHYFIRSHKFLKKTKKTIQNMQLWTKQHFCQHWLKILPKGCQADSSVCLSSSDDPCCTLPSILSSLSVRTVAASLAASSILKVSGWRNNTGCV